MSITFTPLEQKDYQYRVSDHSGTFIGLWPDVESEFSYSHSLNQNASPLEVHLSRSPNNLSVKIDALQDSSSATITDASSNIIYTETQTISTVGSGSDVELNYNVDVYAFYGGYDTLLDANGNAIQDNLGSDILSTYGEPNGKRVYSGYIADYELTYGEKSGVRVVVVPHATEEDHFVFKSGTATTVSYLSADPAQMARDAMSNYNTQGGVVTYDTASIPLTGQSISYSFRLQSIRETIDKTIDLLPAGYYQFVDPGEVKQYLLQKGVTANHTFWYQNHISELKLRKSLTQLVNDVYFIGGDTGSGVDLYVHTSDSTSISTYRRGLDRKSDSRVTVLASATLLNQQEIDQFKDPRYRTTVTISDAVYDIESIKLGQMVAFANFGTFVDSLLLQVVSVTRHKHTIDLDLDMIVPDDTKRLYELKKELLNEQVRDIPSTPS